MAIQLFDATTAIPITLLSFFIAIMFNTGAGVQKILDLNASDLQLTIGVQPGSQSY